MRIGHATLRYKVGIAATSNSWVKCPAIARLLTALLVIEVAASVILQNEARDLREAVADFLVVELADELDKLQELPYPPRVVWQVVCVV